MTSEFEIILCLLIFVIIFMYVVDNCLVWHPFLRPTSDFSDGDFEDVSGDVTLDLFKSITFGLPLFT